MFYVHIHYPTLYNKTCKYFKNTIKGKSKQIYNTQIHFLLQKIIHLAIRTPPDVRHLYHKR